MEKLSKITFPLTIELIPHSCWGKNARAILSDETWQILRRKFFSEECPICGTPNKFSSPLELHEVWEYDDKARIQTLIALIPLCPSCHEVKHIDRAQKIGNGKRAMAHLCKVNNWSLKKAQEYKSRCFSIWLERSKHEWKIDFSFLEQYVSKRRIHIDWLQKRKKRVYSRLDAMEWAVEMLNSEALILDSETTGLRKNPRAEIIQLAVINMSGHILFERTFKPKYKIPKRTITIHGITNERVANEPAFPEVFEEITNHITGKMIITYNADFDRTLLHQTCKIYKLSYPECLWECAMRVFHVYQGGGKRFPKLPNARHSAKEDCYAVLNLLQSMAKGQCI